MIERFDVCVVGSGFGGAVPALRAAQRGLSVVVLERGKYLRGRDLRQTQDLKYFLSIAQGYWGGNAGVVTGKCVGGGSVVYGGVSLRTPSEVFEMTNPATGKRAWPAVISRSALEPYYARASEMLRVNRLPWSHIPKKGGVFAKWLDNLGHTCERAPYAIVDCLECGWCTYGCIYEKKQSLTLNYIPQAEALGAQVKPESNVRSIETLPASSLPYRFGVAYRDGFGLDKQAESKVLVVACGAIETPALLLRSRSGLPSDVSWSEVGNNLTLSGDNLFVALAPEDGPWPMTYQGREDGGVISFAFWKEKKFMLEIVTLFPGQAAALGLARSGTPAPAQWGLANKELMKAWGTRMLFIGTIGLTPGDGRVSVDPSGEAVLSFSPSEEWRAFNRQAHETVRMIVESNGGEIIGSSFDGPLAAVGAGSVHPLGSCRMGEDSSTSVVCGLPPSLGEVWGAPGVFVTDGSICSTALGVNPSLTVAALAERISENIIGKYFS